MSGIKKPFFLMASVPEEGMDPDSGMNLQEPGRYCDMHLGNTHMFVYALIGLTSTGHLALLYWIINYMVSLSPSTMRMSGMGLSWDLVTVVMYAAVMEEGSTSNDEEEKTQDEDPYLLPITHEAVLEGHSKTVTAIDIDHSGSRVLTGSNDYRVLLYDFNGMKNDMKSFRSVSCAPRANCKDDVCEHCFCVQTDRTP